MKYDLHGVRALYPRIDKPYTWDGVVNKSMPCAYTAEGAKYECSFSVTEDIAKDLVRNCVAEYKRVKQGNWPEYKPTSIAEVFREDEMQPNHFIVKAQKKTYGDPNTRVAQFMEDGSRAPDGFQLTTGSIVNALLLLKPWSMGGRGGVTLRLQAVKCLQLAEGGIQTDPWADGIVTSNVASLNSGAQSTPSDTFFEDDFSM